MGRKNETTVPQEYAEVLGVIEKWLGDIYPNSAGVHAQNAAALVARLGHAGYVWEKVETEQKAKEAPPPRKAKEMIAALAEAGFKRVDKTGPRQVTVTIRPKFGKTTTFTISVADDQYAVDDQSKFGKRYLDDFDAVAAFLKNVTEGR